MEHRFGIVPGDFGYSISDVEKFNEVAAKVCNRIAISHVISHVSLVSFEKCEYVEGKIIFEIEAHQDYLPLVDDPEMRVWIVKRLFDLVERSYMKHVPKITTEKASMWKQ